MLDSGTLQFLAALAENNSKQWFDGNRNWYESSRQSFIRFSGTILDELKTFQVDLQHTEIKSCILQINRDIRFSFDKRPYKNYFAAGFGPGGKSSGRADFYLQIEPGNKSMLGGGMWSPSTQNMAKWRQEIDYNPDHLKKIIENDRFRAYFTEIAGSQLKTAPRGYSVEHPEIKLLRYKELFFFRKFDDDMLRSPAFVADVVHGCRLLKPYLDYINALFFDE